MEHRTQAFRSLVVRWPCPAAQAVPAVRPPFRGAPGTAPRRVAFPAVLLVAGLAALAGCGYKRVCPVLPRLEPVAAGDDVLEVRFLGVGGFLIRRGADVILTGPHYSNPTIGEIATQDVNPDGRLIDALLPPEADLARAVFVGHGHYDHLMDVPWIVTRRAPNATVYGSHAVYNVFQASEQLKGRVTSLEPYANHSCHWTGAPCPPGTPPWEPVTVPGVRVRVWTILSEHSAQFAWPGLLGKLFPGPVHLWRGEPFEPPERLPRRPSEWPEGTTLAYVFDFMDAPDGGAANDNDKDWDSPHVAFRIYYQDSAARRPLGYPPSVTNETGFTRPPRVDLALLCLGGSRQVPGAPTELIEALAPRWAIGQHWEEFFNPRALQVPRRQGREPACETHRGQLAGVDIEEFERRARAALPPGGHYVTACPDALTRFVRRNGTWEWAQSTERWYPATRSK